MNEGIQHVASVEVKMRKQLIQEVVGYRIPRYVCEVLVKNYCDAFLKMSIVSDNGKYLFSYDTGYYERLSRDKLLTPAKIFIIRELFALNEEAENHLIVASQYLIEPELVFIRDKYQDGKKIKIMYYPDSNKLSFEDKIIRFMRNIMDLSIVDEKNVYNAVKGYLDDGDVNSARRYLDIKAKKLCLDVEQAV